MIADWLWAGQISNIGVGTNGGKPALRSREMPAIGGFILQTKLLSTALIAVEENP